MSAFLSQTDDLLDSPLLPPLPLFDLFIFSLCSFFNPHNLGLDAHFHIYRWSHKHTWTPIHAGQLTFIQMQEKAYPGIHTVMPSLPSYTALFRESAPANMVNKSVLGCVGR